MGADEQRGGDPKEACQAVGARLLERSHSGFWAWGWGVNGTGGRRDASWSSTATSSASASFSSILVTICFFMNVLLLLLLLLLLLMVALHHGITNLCAVRRDDPDVAGGQASRQQALHMGQRRLGFPFVAAGLKEGRGGVVMCLCVICGCVVMWL